jgi:hypothetical protein
VKKILFFAILTCLILLRHNFSWAEEVQPKSLKGVEFFTGYAWGKLHAQGNYRLTPLIVDLDFDLKPLSKKLGFEPKQLLEFQLEPFLSIAYQPYANIETGGAFFLKAGFLPQTSKLQPYMKAGLGVIYISQHTREQGRQFNFIEQVGLGAHYFFNKIQPLP